MRSGFDLMKIKSWLGHKSLEVKQIYFDSKMHYSEGQKKLDRAGMFQPEDGPTWNSGSRAR
jgi:hypothetical protein